MGCSPFRRSCSSSPYAVPNSNPEPENFVVKQSQRVGRFLILKVHYPNCTNFEGMKVLVFENVSSTTALYRANKYKLDPHFSAPSDGAFPVFARFPPTDKGWAAAEAMCRALDPNPIRY